ncbi:MAG TPA: phosphatidate cytidylyltransferase [Longimicrobiales bacterium]|nr:phosphatidate cytidylyltransferase [Longimicrobiales bacterium]
MSELAKRWAVAGVGIPVVLLLLYLGGWPLALPVAALAALGAREVYGFAAKGGTAPLVGFGAALSAGVVLVAAWRPTFSAFAPAVLGLLAGATAITLVVAMKVRGPTGKPLEAVAVTLFGALYAGLALAFGPLIHTLPASWSAQGASAGAPGAWDGLLLVALPLAATWLGDALALFAGTAWGRGGLAPTISPKKSWVGVWAGLAGAGLAALVWYFVAAAVMADLPMQRLPAAPLLAVVVGVVLGAAAILGDLVESLLKRQAGVKDSGAFFPGHGGVMDRLDALVFTLPTAYVALVVVEALAGGATGGAP